ncbi:MAG: Fe-S cluster assembly ATPase SufC [candidate division KSB1 bacterium]|nr:Fe-S cluster assembly ATPase SufC [candidate division KSB1 bacterium]
MLTVKNLHASVEGHEILKGIDLTVNAGEIHAIMGPNGSGKSTLANIIAGREEYTTTEGEIRFMDQDLLNMPPEQRAHAGLFMAFQYPVEIPGVNTSYFLRTALNEIREARGETKVGAMQFIKLIREKMQLVDMDEAFLKRSVNVGFSGGEKKRNEILQMAVLQPYLSILDETDSGLDIDALKIVANGVNALRNSDNAFILVTHYQRLLDYVIPDQVHVLYQGRIVQSGDKNLAMDLEKMGYDHIKQAAQTAEV